MKTLWTAAVIALMGLVLASCVSNPNEDDDEPMWNDSTGGRLHDLDDMDENR